MIEFAHYVLKAALERNWLELLATPESRWLDAIQSGHISTIYTEAFRRFVTEGEKVTFFTHWNPRMFELSKHVVAISNDSEETEQQVFGHGYHTAFLPAESPTSDRYAIGVQAELGIYIASPQPDSLSFLHRFVRRALLQQALWVISEAGLDSLVPSSSQGLVCPPELVANGIPTMFGRRIGITARTIDDAGRMGAAPTDTTKKPPLVLDEQDQVSSLVNRETRVETDLGGVYQGKVRIR